MRVWINFCLIWFGNLVTPISEIKPPRAKRSSICDHLISKNVMFQKKSQSRWLRDSDCCNEKFYKNYFYLFFSLLKDEQSLLLVKNMQNLYMMAN